MTDMIIDGTISKEVYDEIIEFPRAVFESIIEKVLVGGFDGEGNPDLYKLTFVLKGNSKRRGADE